MELIDQTTEYTIKDKEIIQNAIQTQKLWTDIAEPLGESEEFKYFGIHLYDRAWFSCPNKVWIYLMNEHLKDDYPILEDIKMAHDWLNLNGFESRAYHIFSLCDIHDKLQDTLTQYLKDWKMAKDNLQSINNKLENPFFMDPSRFCELEFSRQRYQYMVNSINYLIYKCLLESNPNDLNRYASFVNKYKEENGPSCK